MKRIAKAISDAGICSRRRAEELIKQGLVKVDGVIIDSPTRLVDENNIIKVSEQVINRNLQPRLWLYYKPAGLVTTHKDTHGRNTVFDSIKDLPRVISVGRLDLNSEGLLLLTNSGTLARTMELPSSQIERVYKVRAFGNPGRLLQKCGVAKSMEFTINGVTYKVKSIKPLGRSASNSRFEVTLLEGKNREIRKIFEHFDLQVNRLIRIEYGPFTLGELKPGEYKEQEFETFKQFLTCRE